MRLDVKPGTRITLQHRYFRCAPSVKTHCTCRIEGNKGHGPYWVASYYDRVTGKRTTRGYGKTRPNVDDLYPIGHTSEKVVATRLDVKPGCRITLREQYRRCTSTRTTHCTCHAAGSKGHGPYWYAYYPDSQGEIRVCYCGKVKPDLEELYPVGHVITRKGRDDA